MIENSLRILLKNTLTQKLEPLILNRSKTTKLFVCGITPYNDAHIGHARTYIFFDILIRFLRNKGVKIYYLQNVTDIDDKIISGARAKKINPIKYARNFEKSFREDMRSLKVISVTKYARASEHIPLIIKQIRTLVKKGHAYTIPNDGLYFDLKTYADYGKLAKRTIDQAEQATSRVDDSDKKRNKGDFALWKFPEMGSLKKLATLKNTKLYTKKIIEGEPLYFTEYGWGRPGWHIEDTAISEYYFGPQYDIHGGAIDLIFPHHEAELSQQESASGKVPFVRLWVHTGFLLVNGEKMSKSKGNFITIKDFLKYSKPNILRLIVLMHHYSSPINFSDELVQQAKNNIKSLEIFLYKLNLIITKNNSKNDYIKLEFDKMISKMEEAHYNDFNTSLALGHIFSFINIINNELEYISFHLKKEIRKSIFNIFKIWGIELSTIKIPQNIIKLCQKREIFRVSKNWVDADKIRDIITNFGFEIEDTESGPIIMPL